jgi:hypothetical protein
VGAKTTSLRRYIVGFWVILTSKYPYGDSKKSPHFQLFCGEIQQNQLLIFGSNRAKNRRLISAFAAILPPLCESSGGKAEPRCK